MRTLSASDLLGVWERGFHQAPLQRALTLLSAACPDEDPDALARLPIGRRDACLLSLREQVFGGEVSALAACPKCSEAMELAFDVSNLRPANGTEPGAELALNLRGEAIGFRLPDSSDLAAVAGCPDLNSSRNRLLDRCLLPGAHDLSEADRAAVAAEMARADPLADVQLSLACPACGATWEAPFDIASFLWSELNAWARGQLREVHAVAAAYGWSEREILSLSPARRRFYLEMVGA